MDLPEGEGYRYRVEHTPWGVAEGEDIPLSLRVSDEGHITRRVLRWHSAVKDGQRRLSISIVHQRRSPIVGWEDARFNLRSIKAGEDVSLDLDAEQTANLIAHIGVLQKINEALKTELGTSYGVHLEGEVVVPGEFGALIEQLRASGANAVDLARDFAVVAPDLANAAGVFYQHKVRSEALAEFRTHLAALDWAERDWQAFFERNDWIFGHGLDYRFLVTEQAQALYGGADVTGRGGQEGDFLMGTAGDARFAVLVEIKKPHTLLLDPVRYRNGAWRPSAELAGGVAQLQANAQQWFVASRQVPNSEWASERGITTAQPKAILVIGRTASLGGNREKCESFERFRQQLWNPEVVTYDELYARAEYIVARTASGDSTVPGAEEDEERPAPDADWDDEEPPPPAEEWDDEEPPSSEYDWEDVVPF